MSLMCAISDLYKSLVIKKHHFMMKGNNVNILKTFWVCLKLYNDSV